MDQQQFFIFRRMQVEMARRSTRACIAFMTGGVFFFIYHLDSTKNILGIQICSVFILLSNFVRIYFSKKIIAHEDTLNMRHVWIHRFSIYANAVSYGLMVSLAFFDYGNTFFYCWFVTSSIIAASTASIVYDKTTIFAVIGFIGIMPALFYGAISHQLIISFLMLVFLLFVLMTSIDFYKRTIQSFKKDLDILDQKSKMQAVLDSIPGFVIGFDKNDSAIAVRSGFQQDILKHLMPQLTSFQESGSAIKTIEIELQNNDVSNWFLLTMVHTDSALLKYLLVGQPIDDLKTAQKTVEEQRAKAQNSAKLATLGEMAAGVAHEINTPLAAIQLNIQVLGDYVSENPEVKKAIGKRVDSITAIVDRIAKIIKGLRMFARNADDDPFAQITARKIIDETLDLCKEKFESAGVQLDVVLPEKDIFVYAQDTQLCQVILNLLNNAFDAARELDTKWIRIEVSEKETNTQIRVVDSGAGISKDVQQKLFQPFFTTKDIGSGTGLGLSISKGILDSHRGTIFYDQENPNTCFVVQVPNSDWSKAAA